MIEEYTESQYLNARKRYLIRMREDLNWSTKEIAKKLKVMEMEYINFENGLTKDLSDFEWDDLKFFLESHLKKLNER